MENNENILSIAATDDTPLVLIDPTTNTIKFEGPSFPENAVEFYTPVVDKIMDVIAQSTGRVNISFDFTILSSASNKVVYELLVRLEQFQLSGKDLHVDWIYETYDEDMFDEGTGYKECLKVPISLVERESE
ncbi:MAG: DUF1987 domain-containing protein [Bacteroidales bacterium]|nr:DUF1987 domain-containing protein [Bacteroidales bacterium]